MKKENNLSLNVQYDFITLKTPNGNFTVNRSGAKASGKLADEAFTTINDYINNKTKTNTLSEAMESLLDPKVLESLWKGWNKPVPVNNFVAGENVKFVNPLFIKRYPNGGVVSKVSNKYVFIQLADTKEVIGFDYQSLTK